MEGSVQCESNRAPEAKFSDKFLLSLWEEVVDAWQLDTWEQPRL